MCTHIITCIVCFVVYVFIVPIFITLIYKKNLSIFHQISKNHHFQVSSPVSSKNHCFTKDFLHEQNPVGHLDISLIFASAPSTCERRWSSLFFRHHIFQKKTVRVFFGCDDEFIKISAICLSGQSAQNPTDVAFSSPFS